MRYFAAALLTLVIFSKTFAQTEGDVFFGSANIHEIRFTFHQTNYWDSLVASYTGDYYIKGDVEIDGTLMLDCGVKFKGNSSYNNPSNKKPLKIDMNEFVSGQEYDGLKKLNLNNCFKDPSFMREKIMNDFLREHGLHAPRVHYANVYINNTLWGLYTAVEEVDVKPFLRNNIGDDRGNMFKGDPSGDLKWLGSTPGLYYNKYELKTNETENDWTDLVNLIDVINNTPISDLPSALDTVFDVDNYIRTWAVHALFSNLDSYLGSGHNYYLYHDSTDNKFKFISWDVNEAFGNFSMGMNITQMETLSIFYIANPAANRPLHYRMLQVPAYEQALVDAVCEFTLYDFSSAGLDAKIDSIADWIRTDVYADPNKFYSNANFETNIHSTTTIGGGPPFGGSYPGLKSFVSNKRLAVTNELVSYGCHVGLEGNAPLHFFISPNPASDYIQITGLNTLEAYQVNVYNALGEKLLTSLLTNSWVSLENISATGVLFVEVKEISSGKSYTGKLVKY